MEISLLNNLVEPTMGSVPSYKALAIIVLGGLGNVKGALLASLALGIIESFGTIYLGNILDRDSIAFAFLIKWFISFASGFILALPYLMYQFVYTGNRCQ